MEEKKRILFITDALGYGGAEKQLAFVAEGLLHRGCEVAIVNLNLRGEHEGHRPIDSNIKVYVANIPFRNSFKSTIDYVSFSLKAAKSFRPSIIVGFKQLGFYAVVVGKLLGVPSIISERADPYTAYKNASRQLRFKLWCINQASGAVFQTEQASLFYSKGLQKRGVVIPNPVFIQGNIPSIDYSNRPSTVVSLGRLDNKQKRLDVMLDAFAIFHKLHPDYQLKIYGNGEDETTVRQWIVDKDLSDCAFLMGVTDNSIRDLSSEGIFLITSDFEGISNSLLEAMACGLPVVSTDHTPGGARMLIINGENGLLTPLGDPQAISNALCRFAEDTDFAEKCGRKAQDVLTRFAPERILDLWESYLVKKCR